MQPAARPSAQASPRAGAAPPAGEPRWQLRLLGAVQAFDGVQRIERFPARAVAALLARLALQPGRAHAREELVELLWPGVALDVGRNRLRQALSTLKSLLEPPDQPAAGVLLADRMHVRVVPGALACDARQFEQLARAGRADEALALYGGELMPGYYDEWIDEERRRLAALHERLLARPGQGEHGHAPGQGPGHGPAGAAIQGPSPSPPPPSAAAEPGLFRLPAYLTRLFGIELAAARLRALVLGQRLVTLLGPGGSGKTRLAVEVATALRDGPAWSPPPEAGAGAPAAGGFDSVAFVPLVACADAVQAVAAIVGALRLPAPAGGLPPVAAPADRLVGALAGRRTLLVLDNLEQLHGQVEPLLAELLARLPGLHLLATSRHALEIDGERCVPVEALPLPEPDAELAAAAANPAVALFVDRARAARADFHLGARNGPDIVALVRALQGMPLALELAAARVRSHAPRDMLLRLQAAVAAPPAAASTAPAPGATPGLDLLARGGPRAGLDARHASMQHTIDWSWRLLSEAERDLLCALTVFRGGCSAEAVRALVGGSGQGHIDDIGDRAAADAAQLRLDALVAHSLVAAPPSREARRHDAPRLHLYEPIREFAAARLPAERAAFWRSRHRQWMLAWAEALPATPELAEVRAEQPNLEAALASAVADGRPAEAIELLLRLRRVLEDVELPTGAMAHAEAAVAACDDPLMASRGHSLLGPLLLLAGRGEAALAAAEAGLAALPQGADPALRGRALHALARVHWRSQRDPAQTLPLIDAAEPLAQAAGDLDLQAGLLALRAFVCNRSQGDHARARSLHEQALALWQRQGNRHAVHSGLYNLAVTQQLAGGNAAVLELLDRLRESARDLQDWRRVSQADNVAGNALSDLRRWPEAAQALRDSLRLAWRTMAPYELAYPLWNLPRALAHLRQPERALRLAAFAAAYWERGFGPLTAADRRDLKRVRRLAACQLDAARFGLAWAEGATLELADAVALALRP